MSSGGVEASWLSEKLSDNTIQAAHSSTFQERDARQGGSSGDGEGC